MPKGTSRPGYKPKTSDGKVSRFMTQANRNTRARAQGREPTSGDRKGKVKVGDGKATRENRTIAKGILGIRSRVKKK